MSFRPNSSTARERALFRQVVEKRNSERANSPAVDLTLETIQEISQRCGVDFATVWLFDQILRSPAHGKFFQEIQQLKVNRHRHQLDATVALIPGAFYAEYPETGADGRGILAQAARSGCRPELVPTLSVGTPTENGRIICNWLGSRSESNIVLVSLSKGGADVKMALSHPESARLFERVSAWINIGGILDGSPMIQWVLSRRLPRLLYKAIFWCRGQDFDFVRELDRGPGCTLNFELSVPEHLKLVHVVGFPLAHHTSNRRARRWHRRLAEFGPNDSVTLLADVCKLPGLILPVWGTDHYLQSGWDAEHLVAALLHYLGQELIQTPEMEGVNS